MYSKLRINEVVDIIEILGESNRKGIQQITADMYGVDKRTISDIKKRITWKFVPRPASF